MQILEAAIQKGIDSTTAMQKALNASDLAKGGSSAISEEEKTFTSQVNFHGYLHALNIMDFTAKIVATSFELVYISTWNQPNTEAKVLNWSPTKH